MHNTDTQNGNFFRADALRRFAGSPFALHLAVFLSMVVASRLGMMMQFTRGTLVSPLWPTSGIAICWLVTCGRRTLPAILAGVGIGDMLGGYPASFYLLSPFVKTAETLTAAWAIRKLKVDTELGTPRDILRFVIAGPVLGPIPSAIGGMGLLHFAGIAPLGSLPHSAALWWAGNAMGILVVTPALLCRLHRRHAATGPKAGLVAGIVALVGIGVACRFGTEGMRVLEPVVLAVTLIIGIILAVTHGLRGASTVTAVSMTGLSIATATGGSYFSSGDTVRETLSLFAYGTVFSVTLLTLGAVVEELRLEKLRTRLTLSAGKISLWEWRRESGLKTIGAQPPEIVLTEMNRRMRDGEETGEAVSGDTTWAVRKIRLSEDAAGPSHLVGVAEDVSERRQLEAAKLRQATVEANLRSVRSFLETHLLFNALAGLRASVRADPEAAIRYTEDLARFLRLSLDAGGSPAHSPLEELRLARAFLDFHRHRSDIIAEVSLPEPDPGWAALRLPAGALNTLIENALKHGETDPDRRMRIRVGARLDASTFRISVMNRGVLADAPPAPGAAKPGGIRYIAEQLDLLHGNRARLHLEQSGREVAATIEIPSSNPFPPNII